MVVAAVAVLVVGLLGADDAAAATRCFKINVEGQAHGDIKYRAGQREEIEEQLRALYPGDTVSAWGQQNACKGRRVIKVDVAFENDGADIVVDYRGKQGEARAGYPGTWTIILGSFFPGACAGAASVCAWPCSPLVALAAFAWVGAGEGFDLDFLLEWLVATNKTPGWCWMLTCTFPLCVGFAGFLASYGYLEQKMHRGVRDGLRRALIDAGALTRDAPLAEDKAGPFDDVFPF